MPEIQKKLKLFKPSVTTKFHIDFDWWKENDSNWRIFLRGFLCENHQQYFEDKPSDIEVDAIDLETAEVTKMDGLLYALIYHCAKQEDFIRENIPVIAKVFRLLLANGNQPMSPHEIESVVNRPARTILTILTGPQVYKGIRMLRE